MQPTPPPNPTTDSEETPTTTTQQTQEPVDPQTTLNDNSAIDSEETDLRIPITSETATDPPILRPSEPTDIGLIVGIVVTVIVVITSVVTVVVICNCAVVLKKHSGKITTIAVPTTANQVYSLNTHQDKGVEESVHNYLEVDLDNTTEAKQNETYVTSIDITTERNQAYGTNDDMIITEGNQAYAMNIITKKNAAYKPVTTVETVNEYDYIQL